MKSLKKVGLVLGAALLVPGMANAGDFVVSGKADFVSDYIWRGLDQNSGFSIQPSLTLSYKGFRHQLVIRHQRFLRNRIGLLVERNRHALWLL